MGVGRGGRLLIHSLRSSVLTPGEEASVWGDQLAGCGGGEEDEGRKKGVFSFYIALIILGIGVCVGWVCGVWRLVGCGGVGREGMVGGK